MAKRQALPSDTSGGDEQLFHEAVTAETPEAFEGAEDPGGAESAPPSEAEPASPPEREDGQPSDRQRHQVPLGELLDERDRRQALEQRLAELERQRAAAQEPPPQPDYLTQPDEFTDQRIRQVLEPMQRRFAIQLAHANKATAAVQHGPEVVERAQQAFDAEVTAGRLHPADLHQVMNNPNPFAAAVEWHKRHEFFREVGHDPTAYRQRLLDEALQDPDYLGRAIEAARAQASGRPVTVPPRRASPAPAAPGRAPLPPSLNRQGPPGGAPPLAVTDADDADLYAEMVNPNKTRE